MNQDEIATAIEDGIRDIASFEAKAAAGLVALEQKCCDVFIEYADGFLPIAQTKYEVVARKDGQTLFKLFEKLMRQMGGDDSFNSTVVKSPDVWVDGFKQFIEVHRGQGFSEMKRGFDKSMSERIARDFQHSDFNSFRNQIQADSYAAETKQILQTLDADLAQIESKAGRQYPKKKGAK